MPYKDKNKEKEYQKQYHLIHKQVYDKDYYETHKEQAKLRQQKYHKLHRKEIAKKRKEYRITHKEEENERSKIYRQEHKIETQEYGKRYRLMHKKEIKLRVQKYRLTHKSEERKYHKIYNKTHRKERNRYQKKIRNTNINFKLRCNLGKRIWDALKGTCKSSSTMKLIGCNIDFFKNYYESKFTKGMTWAKVMNGEIHCDHIRPCASFDLTKPNEQRRCFHYTNLQPLWAEDNLRKSKHG
jgi:hypothetical protein